MYVNVTTSRNSVIDPINVVSIAEKFNNVLDETYNDNDRRSNKSYEEHPYQDMFENGERKHVRSVALCNRNCTLNACQATADFL